jgi:cell division transport system ATP-binding protein
VIRCLDVTKRYPNGREALLALSLEVADGEMLFLTGPSGAGKSTLLRLLAGLERPTRGQILVGQRNLGALGRSDLLKHRRRIGIVFQEQKLLFDRPVWENVALPLLIAGSSDRDADKRVRAALDQVGLLGRERDLPIELSVGEQQRVGIARAVVSKPPLLIADEPTGNVDPDMAREIMALFCRFNEVGVTVIIASHDLTLINAFSKRQVALDKGRVVTRAHD